MYALSDQFGKKVTIATITGRSVRLGFDTDNLIACFPTRTEAIGAMQAGDGGNYSYSHTLALSQATLRIITVG